MPIASEQIELPSFPSRTTMDHETRYDLPSQDIRVVREEDERALFEGERNESTEIISECTPRSSSSPPSRVVFILAVIYALLSPMERLHRSVSKSPVPSFWRHYNCEGDRCVDYFLLVIVVKRAYLVYSQDNGRIFSALVCPSFCSA
jgi:hypothetical protein